MKGQEAEVSTINSYESLEKGRYKFPAVNAIKYIVISAVLGCLSIINYNSNIFFWLGKIIQLLAFAAVGILYLRSTEQHFLISNTVFLLKKLLASLLLSSFIFIVLLLLYVFLSHSMFIMALASSCAFLLPSIIFNAWLLFSSFPQKHYKIWYNFENIRDERVSIFLNSIPLNIKLTLKYFDVEEEIFFATLPGHVTFGKLFNQFLVNQSTNDTIEILDERQNPYGWVFFVESIKGYAKRYIDPELTLRENKVKENTTIVAKRVKKQIEIKNEVLNNIKG